MKKQTFTKQAVWQAAAVGVLAVGGVLFCLSGQIGIGQTYRQVRVDDRIIGYAPEKTDMDDIVRRARQELTQKTGERISGEVVWSSEECRKPFQKLLSENELKEAVENILSEKNAEEKQRVYTVAIDEYRANFATMDEVESFLEKVKASADAADEYGAVIADQGSHVSGILTASLARRDAGAAADEKVLEEAQASLPQAGISAYVICTLEEAFADPKATYETGILDMEFVERVNVFENYVDADQIADVDEQVAEVTKEKESNKIYVVESGDCLSVIAMDHDTTVSSIVALNGLDSADAMIRDGQELIIAVPEPDLQLRVTKGEVYEEDYMEEPIIIDNDSWYTTKEVVQQEGTTGHRERNDVVVYENGVETSREMIHQNVMVASQAAVIERGTIIPPTYIKPISGGRYTSGFGRRWGRMHKGVDWACPIGTTVYASCAGTVISASYNGGYGNNVVISHADGRLTRYAHNSKLLVKAGQHVEQGEPITLSGSTGRSTGPHVHFEIYINGSAVDPLKYISN